MATNNRKQEVTGWVGWVFFAGYLMAMVGMFQMIMGLAALLKPDFYVQMNGHLLALSYTQWGWVHLIYGVVVLMAGVALFSGKSWARVVGVLLATMNLMVQFAYLSVYPVWSLVLMVVDVLVIYALTVHAGELRED